MADFIAGLNRVVKFFGGIISEYVDVVKKAKLQILLEAGLNITCLSSEKPD